MSSFRCEICGADIIDSDEGHLTGCEHWPLEAKPKERHQTSDEAWRKVVLGKKYMVRD